MAESSSDKPQRIALRAHFAEVVRQSLNEIFGESVASSIIYHLGGNEALQNPKIFEKRLKTIFHTGAEVILEIIRKKLEISSGDA